MNDLPITTMCFIRRNGRTLMLRKQRGVLQGKWLTIGGRIESGETPDECVRREAKEESGLELQEICLRGIITFVTETSDSILKTSYAFVYECHAFTEEPISSSEGEIQWVPDTELQTLDIPKKDQILPLIYHNSALFSAKYLSSDGIIKSACVDYYALKSPACCETVNSFIFPAAPSGVAH
jgi:8-oxo-dGTP diphosphatase